MFIYIYNDNVLAWVLHSPQAVDKAVVARLLKRGSVSLWYAL